jgi:NADH-quinone oxidoreductase subunit N
MPFIVVDLIVLLIVIVILFFSLYERKFEEDFGSLSSIKFYLYFSIVCLLVVLYGMFKFRFLICENSFVVVVGSFYIMNKLIIFGKCFVIFVTIICLFMSYNFFKLEKHLFIEYIIFVLLALESILFFLSASDFFVVYLAIEMQAFCFYVVFALSKSNSFSLEASLKYFILSVFASLILLLGISFIYGACGTLKICEIHMLFIHDEFDLNLSKLYALGLFFFLFGILFKLALVPFHYWIGDVYEGLPLITIFWYSSISKIPFIIFLINLFNLVNIFAFIGNFIFYISLLSICFGTLASLYQVNLIRMLAFAAINHSGFILLSLSLGSVKGFSCSLVYLIVYVILNMGIFTLILLFRVLNSELNSWNIVDIVKFVKLSKFNYVFSIFFSCFFLSLAGIPPFSGFFAKLGVFMALLDSGYYFTFLVVALFSVVSAVYYIRLIRYLFFLKDTNETSNFWIFFLSSYLCWVLVFCFLFNILFWFFHISLVYFFVDLLSF